MSVHVLGIRHHGPGSARSMLAALETLRPDCVLVEGPPDADELIPLVGHAGMQPPVAILIHRDDRPDAAVYYPFAEFSPEWQALRYALKHDLPARFIDLPQANQFAMAEEVQQNPPAQPEEVDTVEFLLDPINELARAAGYGDGELWWEHMVEERTDSTGLFDGLTEAMGAAREAGIGARDDRNELREAHMRRAIRAAEKEFKTIAVICGAWHAPALKAMPPAKEDNARLKDLPKVKVRATWIPYTHGRLCSGSGYGAGVRSPGWYEHMWNRPQHPVTRWLAGVARLFRDEGMDISSAHVIEATRLAETLSALRGRPQPGLDEMNEAVQAIYCFGDELPLRLVERRMIVGEKLGAVPEETPQVPLQLDLKAQAKRLRVKLDAADRELNLDLRGEIDLDRSRLLHRLRLLEIPWGDPRYTSGKGTFKEHWVVRWQPEFEVRLIECGVWGNTIESAASNRVSARAAETDRLSELSAGLGDVLLADLPAAAQALIQRIGTVAAVGGEVSELMASLPEFARVLRYGSVRQASVEALRGIVDGVVARTYIALPGACASLDDEAAARMVEMIDGVNGAVSLLDNPDQRALWLDTLESLADSDTTHGLVRGRCARLRMDAGADDAEVAARRMSLALSRSVAGPAAGAWAEGFLSGSGSVLVHDDKLWALVDAWVSALAPEVFTEMLPLLRRTFSTFAPAERRSIGERVREAAAPARKVTAAGFDESRADAVLPVVAKLLGIKEAP